MRRRNRHTEWAILKKVNTLKSRRVLKRLIRTTLPRLCPFFIFFEEDFTSAGTSSTKQSNYFMYRPNVSSDQKCTRSASSLTIVTCVVATPTVNVQPFQAGGPQEAPVAKACCTWYEPMPYQRIKQFAQATSDEH